ncbi:MAG TPA: hypothetical protein VKS60_07525, partial [Stellaceae bacterium]|nr:hypothetical protein [Stellaceae bacterium]
MVRRPFAPALAAALLLAGCKTNHHVTEPPPASPVVPESAPTAAAPEATAGAGRVAELRAQADRLTARVAEDRQTLDTLRSERGGLTDRYFDQSSTIGARLQAGTTPGSPELIAAWQQLHQTLSGLDDSAVKLAELKTRVAADSAEAGYFASSVNAAQSLESEADRAPLAEIQTQAKTDHEALDRLAADAAGDLTRLTDALMGEHRNFPTLLRSIEVGEVVDNAPAAAEAAPATAPAAAPPTPAPSPAPLPPAHETAPLPPPTPAQHDPALVVSVVQSPAEYEPALYKVATTALEKSRNANLEVVAVLPGQGPPTGRAIATEAAKH